MTLIRQLENRRKYEEREKKKHQVTQPVILPVIEQLTNFNFFYEFLDGS